MYLVIAVLLIIFLTTRVKLHPFLALFVLSIAYGIVAGMPLGKIVASINQGFGDTLGSIGIIILFGVMIGAFLEHTGGALKIAEKVLGWIGGSRVPAVMGIIGYIIAIPVFADSGFLLLQSLNKSLTRKAGISMAATGTALGLGLLASHTLVPPTPGPIAAAGILGANLGLVIAFALPVSLGAVLAGIFYASRIAGKTYIDPGITEEEQTGTDHRDKRSPGALRASIPIIIPIVLIVMRSVLTFKEVPENGMVSLLNFLGEPVIALFIGLVLCLLLPAKLEASMWSSEGWVGKAIRDAASIIMITGAGGIFGRILQNSGIGESLGELLVSFDIGILLPFILAAAMKSAQGSSTVALITTASILFPMMPSLGFESEVDKALVVVAIGAGSSVVSHANDSFFWVVTQMSGMNVRQGYRLFSLGTLVLGGTAAFLVWLASLLFS